MILQNVGFTIIMVIFSVNFVANICVAMILVFLVFSVLECQKYLVKIPISET